MRKKLFVLLFLLTTVFLPARAELASSIDSVISAKQNGGAEFTVKIVRLSDGRTLYSRNADKPMIPASNMKLIVSAAAVDLLGTDYKYITRIGLLEDALAVIGSGDPLLADPESPDNHADLIEKVISALKSKSVTEMKDIVLDSTLFDDQLVHPNWPAADINRPHACEVCGINFNANCVKINTANRSGRVRVYLEPYTQYVSIVNKIRPTSKGSSAVGAYRNGHPNTLVLKGRCRKEASFYTAIERPAAFLGFVLVEKMTAAGIKVTGRIIEKHIPNKESTDVMLRLETPIESVLKRCNKDSFGLAADSLLKTIAAENIAGKTNGSWAIGAKILTRWLTLTGLDDSEFVIDDGRGLSRQNRLSANVLTTVLVKMLNSENGEFFRQTLAVGGVDGTVSRYFRESKYKGRVFGKTGYISGVRSFSGVCRTGRGDIVFSILTHGGNSKVRKSINKIVETLIDKYNL